MIDAKTEQQEAEDQEEDWKNPEDQQEDLKNQGEQMCCEGGMTAAEHRAKSPGGKCCTD